MCRIGNLNNVSQLMEMTVSFIFLRSESITTTTARRRYDGPAGATNVSRDPCLLFSLHVPARYRAASLPVCAACLLPSCWFAAALLYCLTKKKSENVQILNELRIGGV